MHQNIISVMTVIDYIEDNLSEKLNLESVAAAVNYSKYHMHRVFTRTVGLTIHDYVQRRQLTEAAKLLIFSDKPIIEIAMMSGYDSQQAFSIFFKQMYKKSPKQYREAEEFYPLQLKYVLNNAPTKISGDIDFASEICHATQQDIPAWMELVRLVVDGFPYLNENEYLQQLNLSIVKNQAYFLKDGDIVIGAMLFNGSTGSIDFLGVHPQYKKKNIAKAFLQKILLELLEDKTVSITTFREGDKADIGYRNTIKMLGFIESELLTEFGYPTQKFCLQKDSLEAEDNE